MFKNICKRIKIVFLQVKLNVCKDGLIDVVLNWNESLQEENKQLKEKVEGYEITRDRLIAMGFPTFMSCKEYAEQINKMKCCQNCKHSEEDNKSSTICNECFELCYWEMKE